jgi:hypothetical protein
LLSLLALLVAGDPSPLLLKLEQTESLFYNMKTFVFKVDFQVFGVTAQKKKSTTSN